MNAITHRFPALTLTRGAVLALALFLTFCGSAPGANSQALRVRKSYTDLTQAERQTYVDAVLQLKATPNPGAGAGDPQNRYDVYVQWHDVDCLHHESGFLPWHRELLNRFENELRGLGPAYANVTIPSWDWTDDPFPADKA